MARLIVAGVLFTGVCGQVGLPSEAQCPTPQTLTYENFGRAFMARKGAPDDQNFDSYHML